MPIRAILGAVLGLLVVAAGPRAAGAACGDFVVDAGEDCDLGGIPDDCCSNGCTWEVAGTPCFDNDPCIYSTCNGADLFCTPSNVPCQPASKSNLRGKSGEDLSLNRLTWKWTASGTVMLSDLGDPINSTPIAVCLRDADGSHFNVYDLDPGGLCFGRPCWRAGGNGFSYSAGRAPFPSSDIDKIKMTAGENGRARIKFSMHDGFFDAPPWNAPVRVWLARDDAPFCWEATFPVLKVNALGPNDTGVLRAQIP